jgi:hypothetical protein
VHLPSVSRVASVVPPVSLSFHPTITPHIFVRKEEASRLKCLNLVGCIPSPGASWVFIKVPAFSVIALQFKLNELLAAERGAAPFVSRVRHVAGCGPSPAYGLRSEVGQGHAHCPQGSRLRAPIQPARGGGDKRAAAIDRHSAIAGFAPQAGAHAHGCSPSA